MTILTITLAAWLLLNMVLAAVTLALASRAERRSASEIEEILASAERHANRPLTRR